MGSGHGKGEQAHSLQNKATAGKHSRQTLRPAQALKKQTASSWPASQQTTAADVVGRPRHAVQVDGGSAVLLATRKAGSDLPTRFYPTYRLRLSLSLPTPLICKNPI